VRVRARVGLHVSGDGPDSPVSELKALVCVHSAVVLEQVAEARRGQVEGPRGLARVEEAHKIQAQVALEPDHVRVRAVEHLGDGGVREGLVEHLEVVPQLQRVHEEVLLARGDLEQAGEAAV